MRNRASPDIMRRYASSALLQGKSFDHGPNVSEDAEIKGVLGLDRSSCQAADDRAATKDERNSVDGNRIARNTNYHELSAN
jgi:hypothetical protein